MTNQQTKLTKWIFTAVGCVAALGACLYLHFAPPAGTTDTPSNSQTELASSGNRTGNGHPGASLRPGQDSQTNLPDLQPEDVPAGQPLPPPPVVQDERSEESRVLQDYLDSNDDEQILHQAEYMLKNSTVPKERLQAVEALRWVGDRKSVARVLGSYLADEDSSISHAALDVYSSILDSFGNSLEYDEETHELTMDDIDVEAYTELWKTAIWNSGSVYDRDKLLIKLSSLTELFSIPIVLDMQESEMPPLQESGSEYLGFITYGCGVTNRAEAEAWLERFGPTINVVSDVNANEVSRDDDIHEKQSNSDDDISKIPEEFLQ